MHFPEETFKSIPKMSKEEAEDILDNWLRDTQRSLTSQQRQNVLNTFNKCPLPLFLKLAFDEACRWKSYTPESETKLPSTIREIIHSLFDRLERIHGKMLVSHALAYISASKNGLTESELEDLLSLDDDVLNDVYQYWTPPVRRLPPLIWLRVRSDLGDYLVERGSDGARVSFWYHRQFIEVSHERYLQDQQESVKVHSNMAEYFQGTWSDGKKKPFVNKQGEHLEMDRFVAQQPLMYDPNKENTVFNKRKLAELPYHLVKSERLNELKETVLCNYDFLLAKLRGMSYSLVMDDFRMAVNTFPEDEELQLLYDTIGLSANALKLEPRQLASQLIGRLFNMQDDGSSSKTHPSITKLLKQLRSSTVPYFAPHSKCLTSSGGPLLHAIAEHDISMIDSICLANDNSTVVTTGRGNGGLEIRIFNVRAGLLERKLILTQPLHVFVVWHTIMSRRDKQKLVMIGGRNILVFDLKSGEMVHQFEAMSEGLVFKQAGFEIPPVALGNEDKSVAALTDKGVKIWNMETGKLEHEVPVKGVDPSGSTGALDASKEYVAYSKKDSTDVTVISINSGKVIQTIKSCVEKTSGSYVKFIKLTDEGKLVVMSSNSTELKVFDAASGKLLKNVVGFNANITIKELLVTSDGRKLICQDKLDLAIWDMESWKCRKVLNDAQNMHSPSVKTNDGKIVVHANFVDRVVRIYDACKDEGKEATANASSTNQWILVTQINALYPSCDNRHFITTGTDKMSSEISIWDVNQGKQVRVFKNLMICPNFLRMISPTLGVGYIYNEKMHHYALLDFAKGKIVRQFEGKACKRIYMMEFLDKNRMVSFTRGRRHLKIWNIKRGKVIQQIELGQKHRLEAFLLSGNKKIMVIAQAGSYSGEMKDKTIPFIVYNFSTGKQHEIRENEKQLKLESYGMSITGSISHSGRYMINVNGYTSAVLWDVTAGKRLHSLSNEQRFGQPIYSSVIIEEKNIALTSFSGSTNGVFMWDIKSGECVKVIITVTPVNEIKPSGDQRLLFWKDMQGPNFFVHELKSGRNLAAFTSDKPIAPHVFNVINDHVVIGAAGSIDPVIFRLHEGNESGAVGKSVFEDGSNVIKNFPYDGKTLPPDPRDIDTDQDDDDSLPC